MTNKTIDLPDSINIRGWELTKFASHGGTFIYSHHEVPYTVELRRDPQGRLEEKIDVMLGLVWLTTDWSSFENEIVRQHFFRALDACQHLVI
jgi:hypothetical protein